MPTIKRKKSENSQAITLYGELERVLQRLWNDCNPSDENHFAENYPSLYEIWKLATINRKKWAKKLGISNAKH